MKKKLFKMSILATLLLVAFIIVFVLANLFDAPEPEGVYTMKGLIPASLKRDNGYYLLMALSYPADMDISSSEVATDIRKFSEPALLSVGSKEIHNRAKKHNDSYKKLKLKGETEFTRDLTENFEKIISEKEKIEESLNSNQVLMERYSLLLLSDRIEEFSLPTYSYPIPHIINFVKATRLYIAQQILIVLEGKWDEGVNGILKQVSFFRKFGSKCRQLINKSISLVMMRESLRALVFIMSQKDCPQPIFSAILDGLPPLKEQEISLRNPILFEFLNATQGIEEILRSKEPPFAPIGVLSAGFWPDNVDWLNFLAKFRIFLNKNRTTQFYLDEFNKILKSEQRAPYLWQGKLTDNIQPDHCTGLLWWFRNPIGKAIMAIGYSSYQTMIFEKYQTQALFDLVKIYAEYHQKFTVTSSLTEILLNLESYKSIDPFSGKSYIIDEKKQILYSIGVNGIDDKGNSTKDERNRPLDQVIKYRLKRT